MKGLWERLTGATCPGCGRPLDEPLLCPACRALLAPRHLPRLVYLGNYRSLGRLSKALKYRGHRALATHLGQCLALGVQQAGWGLMGITAVPTLIHRQVLRGYNPAEALAQSVAQTLGLPYRRVLVRVGWDKSQTQKTWRKRLELPEGVFRPADRVEGAWLLVDDVITTGTTFQKARKALLQAGASQVYGAAIAVKSPNALGPYFL